MNFNFYHYCMTNSGLHDIDPSDAHEAFDRRQVAAWSHQQLVAAAARVVAVPRAAPADSFVLHAPLELLARAALVRYLAPPAIDAARRRIVWLAASYEAAGDAVATPPPVEHPTLDAAAAHLIGAIRHGDLDTVDRDASFLGDRATPQQARRLLIGALAPALAAAGHAPILTNLLPHGDGRSALVRGPARELARHPEWRLDWFDGLTEPDAAGHRSPNSEALVDALCDVPMLGLPGSDFIFPIMHQVQDGGLAAKLLTGPVEAATDTQAAAQQITRVAAWSMLQEPSDYAPYGWTHCLTMPQAVMAQAGDGLPHHRAVAIAATHVAGFRAALGQVHLRPGAGPGSDAGATAPGIAADWRDGLDGEPPTAARAVLAAPATDVAAIVRTLAERASRHHDAHLVKYTLACLDARHADPQCERLYLAAAASLAAWWSARANDGFFG